MGRAEDLMARTEQGQLDYVDTLIAEAKHEELFLDFKQSGNGGSSRTLHDSDLKNLRKALSGFANSEGGLLLWGIGTDRSTGADRPTREPGLDDCRAFAGRIDAAVSGGTIPPVPGVRSVPIVSTRDGRGYVATLIPASPNAPHQSVADYRYYVRAGSDFVPAPHGVLAGLFGRHPRAHVAINFSSEAPTMSTVGEFVGFSVPMGLMLVNLGAVVASDAYLAWEFPKLGGPNCRLMIVFDDIPRWQVDAPALRIGSSLAKPGNRLAPKAMQLAMKLAVRLVPPFHEDLHVRLTHGCSHAPPDIGEWTVPPSDLERLVEKVREVHSLGDGHQRELIDAGAELLGLNRVLRRTDL